MTDPHIKAKHFSEGKVGLDQIPAEALLELGRVYQMGAMKYGRDNWRAGTDWHEFYGSALRHLMKWWLGENLDEESGLNHLAHVMWNIVTLYYYQQRQLGKDDRDLKQVLMPAVFPKPKPSDVPILDRDGLTFKHCGTLNQHEAHDWVTKMEDWSTGSIYLCAGHLLIDH